MYRRLNWRISRAIGSTFVRLPGKLLAEPVVFFSTSWSNAIVLNARERIGKLFSVSSNSCDSRAQIGINSQSIAPLNQQLLKCKKSRLFPGWK